MARVFDLNLSGRVGNLIYYQMNGKTYARRAPVYKNKPTERQKLMRENFGIVSKFGSRLLQRMKGELFHPLATQDYNKARGWMKAQFSEQKLAPEWKINSSKTSFCSLHGDIYIMNRVLVSITFDQLADGRVLVQVPAFVPAQQIIAPPQATNITMRMMLISSAFTGLSPALGFDSKEWSFPFQYVEQPAHEFTLSAGARPGEVMILVVAIRYTIVKKMQQYTCQDSAYALAAVLGMGRVSD